MTALCVAQFVKVLNSIDGSKRRGEVFSDFCELAYCALAKVAAPTVDDRDKLECQYMEVVARYQNKDDIRKMPELLAISYDAINAGGIDFLGSVAGELGTLDAKLGQFFTPYAVSRMMAEIILQGAGEVIDKKGFITIQEPAVGAGGMLLAAADVIEEMGFPRASCVGRGYRTFTNNLLHGIYSDKYARNCWPRYMWKLTISRSLYQCLHCRCARLYQPQRPSFRQNPQRPC